MKNIRSIMKRGWLAIAALALVFTLSACTAAPGDDIEITDDVIAALTPDTGGYQCETDSNGLVVLKDIKVSEIETGDGYGPPLPKEPTAAKLQERLCGRVVDGVVFGHFLANLRISGWSPLDAEANAHLKQFVGDPADPDGWDIIAERVHYYVPLLDVKNPSEDQVREAIARNLEWKDVASKLASLIDHLEKRGILSQLSTLNYHGQPLVSGLRPVGINDEYEEKLPAFTFSLTNKIGQCVLKVGWNMKDGRLEQFDCSKERVPTSTPTGKGVCLKDCGTPPPCKQNCGPGGKNPAEDPNARGNAPRGGGKNDDPGKGPKSSQTPAPTTPRKDPDPPKATPAPTKPPEVTRPDPPAKEPPAPQPKDPGEPGDLVDP